MKPISPMSSSYHGKLQAVALALESIVNKKPLINNRTVHILIVCQSVVHTLANGTADGNYGKTVRRIQDYVTVLYNREVKIYVFWTAGHIDLPGNDIADQLAKQVALGASSLITDEPLSQSEAKALIKKSNLSHWQRRWDNGDNARFTYNLFPKIKIGNYKSLGSRAVDTKLIRLRTGFSLLNEHMNNIFPLIYPTPDCECDTGRASVQHFIAECPSYKLARAHLLHKIELVFIKNNVPINNRFINIQVLLGQPAHLTEPTIVQLQALVANFVQATGATI